MKNYVLDSSAILLYLRDAPDAGKVEKLFQQSQETTAQLAISAVNWAECRFALMRQLGRVQADAALSAVANDLLEIVPVDRVHAESAADLRTRFNGSLADSFAATLAIRRGATLVTSDPEFEAIKKEVKILRMQSR